MTCRVLKPSSALIETIARLLSLINLTALILSPTHPTMALSCLLIELLRQTKAEAKCPKWNSLYRMLTYHKLSDRFHV